MRHDYLYSTKWKRGRSLFNQRRNGSPIWGWPHGVYFQGRKVTSPTLTSSSIVERCKVISRWPFGWVLSLHPRRIGVLSWSGRCTSIGRSVARQRFLGLYLLGCLVSYCWHLFALVLGSKTVLVFGALVSSCLGSQRINVWNLFL